MSDTDSGAGAPIDAYRFPCAQCGAQLRFTPGQRRLTCQYCGYEQDIPHSEEARDAALETLDLRDALANHLPPDAIEETRVLSCTIAARRCNSIPRSTPRNARFADRRW